MPEPSGPAKSPPKRPNPNARFVDLAHQIGVSGPVSFANMSGGRVTAVEAKGFWRGVEPGVRRAIRHLAVLKDINHLARSLNGPGVPPESLTAEEVWPPDGDNIMPSRLARKQAIIAGAKSNGDSVSPC